MGFLWITGLFHIPYQGKELGKMTNILKEKAGKIVDEASKAADSVFDSAKDAVSGTVKGAEEKSENVSDTASKKIKSEMKQ